MVKAVKRAESFIIRNVILIGKNATVNEAASTMLAHNISGLPVVEEGKLVGILTSRDVKANDPTTRVVQAMTKEVITANEDVTEPEALAMMRANRIEKLPVVDKDNNFKGLITYKDITLKGKYQHALRDKDGRLVVGAAVSPFDLERAKALSAFADALVVDVAHFHNSAVIAATKKIMKETGKEVVIGNLGTKKGVLDSVAALDGVAGLRMGIGSGSICITTEVTRAGSPTLFAVSQAADALEELGSDIPIIADGGIRTAGDAALAFVFGASAVMMGQLFAGCEESPSQKTRIEDKYYKVHRGMGSNAARARRAIVDRYADSGGKNIEEGIEILVPYRGRVDDVVDELVGGLRAAIGYAGANKISEMRSARVALVRTMAHKDGMRLKGNK
jgi:IMP dehydrogenase